MPSFLVRFGHPNHVALQHGPDISLKSSTNGERAEKVPSKKVRGKSAKSVASQPTNPFARSPTTRSNTAAVRDGATILDANEQKACKLWLAEIKLIQGLIICRCGLDIQAASYYSQAAQDALFV